jgi:histidinol-phosphatase (PHP family)
MPPISDQFLYPIEIEMGHTAITLQERFRKYMAACKSIQEEYKEQIEILVGFETEAYTGSFDYAEELILSEKPDYIVGSVHHVNDMDIDSSKETYAAAIKRAGSIEKLYMDYFDIQLDMIQQLQPAVIGHFDLIRIYDSDYKARFNKPVIFERIERNLDCIKKYDLILDYNLKALRKGANEPYVSEQILSRAIKMGIKIVPGDDSHGVDTVGLNINKGIQILDSKGVNKDWPKPKTISY